MKKAFKFCTALGFVLFAAVAIAAIGFFAWLTFQPRSLPYISSYIEKTFDELGTDFRVVVSDSVVRWSGWERPLTITTTNLQVVDTKTEVVIANLPEIKLGFDFLQLFFGNVRFKDIYIKNPKFRINITKTDESTDVTENQDKDEILKRRIEAVTAKLTEFYKEKKIPFRLLNIRDAEFTIVENSKEYLWRFKEISARLGKIEGVYQLATKIDGNFSGKEVDFETSTRIINNNVFATKVRFNGLNANILKLFEPENKWYAAFDVPINGSVDFYLSENLQIHMVEIDVVAANRGTFTQTDYFDSSLEIENFSLNAILSDDLKTININDLSLDFAGTKISISNFHSAYADLFSTLVKGKIEVTNLPVETLKKMWPPKIAPDPREWIAQSLSDGVVESAVASFNIKPGDMGRTVLPDDALAAKVKINGVTMSYQEHLPPIKNMEAEIEFGGNFMNLNLIKADIGESKITSGLAHIPELVADIQYISIKGESNGPAKDLEPFINLQKKNSGSKNIEITAGKADSKFFIKFPLLKDLLIKDIELSVNSALSDLSIPDVARNTNLARADINAKYVNSKLELEGKGFLRNIYSDIAYSESYKEDNKVDSKLTLSANLNAEDLIRIGITDDKIFEGELKTNLLMESVDGTSRIEIDANAKNANIKIPQIGLTKPEESPADIKISATYKDESRENIPFNFSMLGAGLNFSGGFNLSRDFSEFISMETDKFTFADSNLKINLNKIGDKHYKLLLTGDVFDARNMISDSKKFGAKPEIKKDEPTYEISANIANIKLLNDKKIRSANIYADYNGKFRALKFNGDIGDKEKLAVDIKREAGTNKRLFKLTSENAGNIIAGLDISENFKGGVLDLSSIILDGEKEYSEGRLIIKNYSLRNAPVLGRILGLASLTGILDALSGKGLEFKKFDMKYKIENDTLYFDEATAYGNSIGITAQGNIEMKDTNLNVSGTIVPAYALNSVIGRVPLVGQALVGGEGGGVIASNFKVEGKYPDANVSVNPLSLLTPGFLRKMFEAFDTNKPKTKPEPKIEEKKPETKVLEPEVPLSMKKEEHSDAEKIELKNELPGEKILPEPVN